jgi:hypothetical protein
VPPRASVKPLAPAVRRPIVDRPASALPPIRRSANGTPRARSRDGDESAIASPIVRFGLAFFALTIVAFIVFAVRGRARGPDGDEGVVREHLVARELTVRDPLAQANHWLAVDAMGARGARAAVTLLGDASRAESGGSHSNQSVRELAHEYLIHFASTAGVGAPESAKRAAESRRAGRPVESDEWPALQQDWRAWVAALDSNRTATSTTPALATSAAPQ